VYVRYLRKKIGPDHLKTVRGMGYRFTGEAGPTPR
jgi:DNA-binding response OmpR family regulator